MNDMKSTWLPVPLIPEFVRVAKFRMKLAEFFSNADSRKGVIYSTGAHGEVLLMSPETLEGIEKRHAFNVWARKAYTQLDLDSMMVLENGALTRKLPEYVLKPLSAFFRLVRDVLDEAADSTCDARLSDWKVASAVYDVMKGDNVMVSGVPFWNGIHKVMNGLFRKELVWTEDVMESVNDGSMNISQFLGLISACTFDEKVGVPDADYLMSRDITKEQRIMISDMVNLTTVFARQVLWVQPLDFDMDGSDLKRIEAQYGEIREMYEKYIGPVPQTSFFPV